MKINTVDVTWRAQIPVQRVDMIGASITYCGTVEVHISGVDPFVADQFVDGVRVALQKFGGPDFVLNQHGGAND